MLNLFSSKLQRFNYMLNLNMLNPHGIQLNKLNLISKDLAMLNRNGIWDSPMLNLISKDSSMFNPELNPNGKFNTTAITTTYL